MTKEDSLNVPKKRKLRVFGVPWHTVHQRALARMPFIETYDLLIEPWRGGYATTQRPFPEKMRYVTHFRPNYYDLAILHVDQQCIYLPEKGDRISKGRLYMEVNDYIRKADPDLPVFVINHMTPFHDTYKSPFVVDYIKKIVGDNFMIVNSNEARKQWGFGYTITHGIVPSEWGFDVDHFNETGEKRPVIKEPRVTIVLSPAGMEKAYRRIFLRQTLRILDEYDVPYEWVGVTKKFSSFDGYRDFLGKSLVFFNPTWQSPRPRARTEAFMSGCCVVSTPYQDADTFITSGELVRKPTDNGKDSGKYDLDIKYDENTTGFLTRKANTEDPRVMDNPQETADLLKTLVIDRPDVALQVGKQGQKMAAKKFNKSVFDRQWEELLVRQGILHKDWNKK